MLPCEDNQVSPEVEAGAKSLYQSSINAHHPDSWKWLTPHIRNRWRTRFILALHQYYKEKSL